MVSQPKLSNRHQLEAILNSAIDAIITIDHLGVVQLANPATETLFQYCPEELLGNNVNLLMPSPYRENHDQYLRDFLETGARKIIGIGRQVVGRRKDGSEFPIHLAVTEIKIDNQRLFTGIIRDISDVKVAESKLAASERLAAIGQMVAGLAHESRNAFQRSHACLAILALDLTEMPESLKLVEKTQKALDDLNFLYEEVRDYAAPIVLKPVACDFVALVNETWFELQLNPLLDKAELSLQVDDAFPKSVMLDKFRIQQVIRNILENAKYQERERPQIFVRFSKCDGVDSRVQLTFDDDGSGVPEEQRGKIFEPFFTTKTKGTGLGLAICKRVVEAHNGTLRVGQSPYGGAQFVMELPSHTPSGALS